MNKVKLYEFMLLAPIIIFSTKLVISEIAKTVSVSDYSRGSEKVKNFVLFVTRSKLDQNRLNEELSAILQMSSIMISAGESPLSALQYISNRSQGLLPNFIRRSFLEYQVNRNLSKTLEYLAARTSSSQIRRLANSINVATERGSPIIQVLQNQIESIKKQIHINLLKKSGRNEIALLVPVVFLILPVSIMFAIWPSLYGLNSAGL